MSRLESVQSVLETARGTRLRQVFHTRWLSFEGAVQSVLENFPGLVSVFMGDSSAKALAMHKPITSVKFLYTLHFLVDVLKHLAILCNDYQRSGLDFSQVNMLLESTVQVLTELIDRGSGSSFKKFLGAVPSEPCLDQSGLFSFQYLGHTIRDGYQQRLEAKRACEAFVTHVIENLESRFVDEGDARVLGLLTDLFRPSLVQAGVGDEVIDYVVDYLVRCGIGSEMDCRQETVGFQLTKIQLGRNSEVYKKVADVLQLGIRCRDSFPLVAMAAERLLVTPVSTADCERGFSRQNLIKTSHRNRLSSRCLEDLMRLSMYDREMNFDTAFSFWAKEKTRRILVKY